MTSSDFTAALITLGTLFFCVALPVTLHYRVKLRAMQGPSEEDRRMAQDLVNVARKLEARIVNLEAVLDAEVPGWRSRSGV